MKEIEKIGLLLQGLLGRLIARKENLSITVDNGFEETNELLFNETGFELDKFIVMDYSESKDYISAFKGLNTVNLEMLADILFQTGIASGPEKAKIFLEKALQIMQLCNETDKTFSFERETKIAEINELLDDNGRA